MRFYEGDPAYEVERVRDPATQLNSGWRYKIYRVRPSQELLGSGEASTQEEAERAVNSFSTTRTIAAGGSWLTQYPRGALSASLMKLGPDSRTRCFAVPTVARHARRYSEIRTPRTVETLYAAGGTFSYASVPLQ